MTVIKTYPINKVVHGNLIKTSDLTLVSESEYTTSGEGYIIVKDVQSSKIKLNSTTTDHITIKALTQVLIIPDVGRIDEDYDELLIGRGACVEFYFGFGNWYILSSDGLKGS